MSTTITRGRTRTGNGATAPVYNRKAGVNTNHRLPAAAKRHRQQQAIIIQRTEAEEGAIQEKLIASETIHHLYRLLDALPLRCRQVFQMFYLQDKALREITRELNISVNTVKTQKQRPCNCCGKTLHP